MYGALCFDYKHELLNGGCLPHEPAREGFDSPNTVLLTHLLRAYIKAHRPAHIRAFKITDLRSAGHLPQCRCDGVEIFNCLLPKVSPVSRFITEISSKQQSAGASDVTAQRPCHRARAAGIWRIAWRCLMQRWLIALTHWKDPRLWSSGSMFRLAYFFMFVTEQWFINRVLMYLDFCKNASLVYGLFRKYQVKHFKV